MAFWPILGQSQVQKIFFDLALSARPKIWPNLRIGVLQTGGVVIGHRGGGEVRVDAPPLVTTHRVSGLPVQPCPTQATLGAGGPRSAARESLGGGAGPRQRHAAHWDGGGGILYRVMNHPRISFARSKVCASKLFGQYSSQWWIA